MILARAATGLIAVLVALVVLAPLPASAGTQVLSTKMVCADVTLDPLSVTQTAGTGTGSLATTPADVQVKFVMSGLPASSPALCLVACVVDGDITIFSLPLFEACGTTSGAGKLTVNTNIPLVDINGGCLVPLMAVAVIPPFVTAGVTVPETAVICAPGFGTFEPPVCLTTPCDQ